ncbi:Appr-1-p processing protein [Streptomyces sp. 8L]|uniref:Appr-1-p processing protein n=1 Tax=Streptomyces sp. 8L TaxID=2877242 RepID=UPI001CD35F3B|nr:Appr-1-p processing protein [Streptomyces sp. 8L]MCA1222448.1 Appr-1-p processing protein [Streptomyces sp. 8L]
MSTHLRYVTGDATNPPGTGPRIIAHVCNDIGAWGRGFVTALSRRGKEPEVAYRGWYRDRDRSGFALGAVQLVPVHHALWVANMIGQHGIRRAGGQPPIRYEALEEALGRVAIYALHLKASVHMPRIGASLAGGDWQRIEPLIIDRLCGRGINVTVYDLP